AGRKAAERQVEEAKKEADYQAAMQLAKAAAAGGKWADAIRACDSALKIKPGDKVAIAAKKAAQVEIDRLVEARRHEAAYLAAMQWGAEAAKAKRYAEAREGYAEALRHRPGDRAALQGCEEAAWLLGREEVAEGLFREGMDAWLGLTVQIDEERALERFGRAAAAGHAVAEGWVGRLTFLGRG